MEFKACQSCGETMNSKDHRKNCYSCRSTNRNCIECGREFHGARRKCHSCNSLVTNERQRDRKYGLTEGEYDAMFILQNGKCAICQRMEKAITKTGRSYRLVVDHDHNCCPGEQSCGQCVRGLICRNCNVLLGMAEDDISVLRNAMNYLLAFSLEKEDQPSESFGMAQVGGKKSSLRADPSSINPAKD